MLAFDELSTVQKDVALHYRRLAEKLPDEVNGHIQDFALKVLRCANVMCFDALSQ